MDLPYQNMNPKDNDDSNESLDSLMQLDNFKSNFARRLSSRSITKSKRDTALKLCVRDDIKKEDDSQTKTSEVIITKEDKDSVKPQKDIIKTLETGPFLESTKLNMEIETLRWQLTQTESNRQMQIELLKEIVCFLVKVKEHMTTHIDSLSSLSNSTASVNVNASFEETKLPRSVSVLNLKRNPELLNVNKYLKNKKVSKSNSNVSRSKDIHHSWTPSSVALASEEKQNTRKLTDEITRLITLANDFIKTKIPDLACTNEPNESIGEDFISEQELLTGDQHNLVRSLISSDESNQSHYDEAVLRELSLTPNSYPEEEISEISTKKCSSSNKKEAINYNEAESGFSSMNSYQEIGVPEIIITSTPSSRIVAHVDHPEEGIHPITESILETLEQKSPKDRNKHTYLSKLLNKIKYDDNYLSTYEDENENAQPTAKNSIFSTSYTKDVTGYIDLYQNIGIPVINVIPQTPLSKGIRTNIARSPVERGRRRSRDVKQEGKVFWV